ncbi:TetR/AcrR family transcriptional regulator [Streptomyces mangrovisoli]|uniref:TetR family transcriptional regulator n=1 Tax=Streptomyces mangrovisoli TaxID=1428628 RepID=A0A1J4P1C9_9ACTN|nr:TetR/AcrR family transcriptional regulator [Streptomyces mangrovisoli]OIJ68408.1 TetR family transcriptional regulator [Streptomyces mangrovisoli]
MATSAARSDDFAIREPRQERTRQAWMRILDAGVALVEEGGYEAFTIAALCDRAQVAPRALYDRTTNKDALFLAVYEHGIARIAEDQRVFADPGAWQDLAPSELITAAVAELSAVFRRHAAFLKPVMLLSGVHPEVARRGSAHVRALGDAFTALLLRERASFAHPDPDQAAWHCFGTVFSACAMRTSHGAGFAMPAVDHEVFTAQLALTARRSLLCADPTG